MGAGHYDTMMVSTIGLGNMIGRVSSGIIVTAIPRFGARTTVSVTNFLAGLAAISSTLYNVIEYQFACMLIFGLTIGFFSPLRSIIIVDFLGLNKLTSATGMMILFQGIGAFAGAPTAEAIMDLTKNIHSPFYLCGGALVFGSLVLCPMRKLQRWEKRKEKKIQQNQRQ
ncbi:hypothetical protein J6590_036308 [Homalodisca vitripennis]|nr:hypothetical protein J6590_036308 [Homalodisca vitripennis]